MNFFIGILTFILVINSGLLILLVLVQLPKKDAGAGMAFGAGTADALFGAGSGQLADQDHRLGGGHPAGAVFVPGHAAEQGAHR